MAMTGIFFVGEIDAKTPPLEAETGIETGIEIAKLSQ
jgi:hypothetical protein